MRLQIDDAAKNTASAVPRGQTGVDKLRRRPNDNVTKSLLLLLSVIGVYCCFFSQAFAAGCSPSLTFTTANPTQTFELQAGATDCDASGSGYYLTQGVDAFGNNFPPANASFSTTNGNYTLDWDDSSQDLLKITFLSAKNGATSDTITVYTCNDASFPPTCPANFPVTLSLTFPGAATTVPGAPTIGTATAGNGQATVTFTAPASNGGSVVTTYTATSSPGRFTGTVSGPTAAPITVTGLTNGTAYTFTVTATNTIGTGTASAASNSVTPVTVPGAPTIGTATAGNGQATVTFTAPASNGGSAVTTYTATSSPGGFTGTASGPTAAPITITGLTNGTAYSFTVTATNTIGTGTASAASNSVTPATVPGAPTIGTATRGNGQATVTFTAPASNGGSAVTTYTATSSPGGFTGTISGPTAAPITVTGLTNGTAYTFTVTATNTIGTGTASAASNSVTPVTVPGAPTIGTATAGNGQATVTFTAPASNGGSAVTTYTATSSPGGFTGTASGPTAAPITITGLTNGTAYSFTVTATNTIGTGTASAASNSVTPTAPPTAQAVNASVLANSSNNSISLDITGIATSVTVVTPASHGTATASGTSITYTPTTGYSGPDTFTYSATNISGTSTPATVTITVAPTPGATQSIASVVLTAGRSASDFTPVTGSGGFGTLSYAVSPSLPSGLSFSTTTGQVSGTPTVARALTTYTVTVTDANSATAAATFELTVNAAVTATQAVASTVLTVNHAATSFTPVTASGGTGTLTYGVAPALPNGLTLDASTGAVTGTPTIARTAASYTVTVTDANSATATASFNLTVNGSVTAVQAVASTVLTLNKVATAFTPVTASGGTGTLSYAVVPALPAGLAFNTATGAITGTPTALFAATTFTVTVTDGNGASASAGFSLTVAPPTLTFTQTTLPDAVLGTVYRQTLVASGGTAPYQYAVATGSLPAGVTLDPSTGVLSGTPTAAGSNSFTILATDAHGVTGSLTYTVVVTEPAVTAVSSTATVAAGGTVTIDLTAGASGGPFTEATLITLSPPSAGTALITLGDTASSSDEVIAQIIASRHFFMRFTASPTFVGTASATFTLSSAAGTSAPTKISFVITDRPDPSKDPEVIGLIDAQTDAAKRFAQSQISNVNDHLEQLHDSSCLRNDWGISLSDSRDGSNATDPQVSADGKSDTGINDPGQRASDPANMKAPRHGDAPKPMAEDGNDCSALGNGSLAFWTGGMVNFGSMSLSGSDSKFDFTTIGITIGADYRFSPTFTAGLGLGFNSDQSRIGDNGTDSEGKDYSAAVYGSYHPTSNTFIDGLVGYGLLDFSSKRFVTGTGDYATGDRNGDQVFGSISSGYEFKDEGLLISPYSRLSASRSTLDTFIESGGDWANLHYGSQTVDTLTGSVGLRIEYAIQTDWGSVSPKARVEYGHDFAGNSRVALSYADQSSGRSYNLATDGTGDDFLNLDVGTDMRIGNEWTIGLDYGATLGQSDGSVPQQVRINIGARF
jgi:uncharacterized protein YhjY with autotransporter beta-barrel domain